MNLFTHGSGKLTIQLASGNRDLTKMTSATSLQAAAATFMGGNWTIAIVGDSTSFYRFLSLTHLLGVPQALPKGRRKDALLISRAAVLQQ
jgi:hypothetical protein